MKRVHWKNALLGVAAAAVMAGTGMLVPGSAMAAGKQYTFAMITHAQPGDTFWDIIRKGANAAAAKDNVKLVYLASPDANKEAELIQNVTQQHVDGIALTLAFPDAEAANVKAAQKAGIPIVGFNAGVDQWKQQGLLGYAGQDETVAGKAVGDRLNQEGAKNVVCLDQQQGAVQLEARCDGIKATFKGKRFPSLEAALADGPKFFEELMSAVGSRDGREVVVALAALRDKLALDRDGEGRYFIASPAGQKR